MFVPPHPQNPSLAPNHLQHKARAHTSQKALMTCLWVFLLLPASCARYSSHAKRFRVFEGIIMPQRACTCPCLDSGIPSQAIIPSLPGQFLLLCQVPQISTSFFICLFGNYFPYRDVSSRRTVTCFVHSCISASRKVPGT